MANQSSHKRRRRRNKREHALRFYDYNLVFLVIFLVVIGLIMIFSAAAYSSEDSNSFFIKQVIFAVVGIAVMIGVSFIPYQMYRGLSEYGMIIAAILILLVKTPLGHSSHGAARWIQITGNLTIQPAEIAKIAVILFSAMTLSRLSRQMNKKKAIIFYFAAVFILCGLIMFVTNNLSSALIVGLIAFGMFFIVHPKLKPFIILAGCVAAFLVILVMIVQVMGDSLSNFRFGRILAWLNPEGYSSDQSYQTLQALYAIGSGGLFGKGLGSSAQKLILPEVQNDMIFSIVCEELGLFGAMVIILLFILLLYRIVYIARNVKDMFASLIAIGVFVHIAVQVILNIAVVTNFIPNTGISLPFISAGGSSLVFLLAEIGMVLNVSRNISYE